MNQTTLQPPYICVYYGQACRTRHNTESSYQTVTTLQVNTEAGAARRCPRVGNSVHCAVHWAGGVKSRSPCNQSESAQWLFA